MKPTPGRRKLLTVLGLLPAGLLPAGLLASTTASADTTRQTASAAAGPFYPTPSMRFPDIDNDLVKIESRVREAGGEILQLSGQVTTVAGEPLPGVRIEIWQCDVNGRYLHTKDNNSATADPDFQGFGFTVSDEAGRYAFRTIKPVSYPGRTPHIHVKLLHGDTELITQLYLKDHPQNERDGLYRRMSAAERATVDMTMVEQGDALTTEINLVV